MNDKEFNAEVKSFHLDSLKMWKDLLKKCREIIMLLKKEKDPAAKKELVKWRKAERINKNAIRRHERELEKLP